MEKLNCKGKLVTKQEKKKEIEVMSKQMKPNTQVNKKKGASGITLIALIITIIILIILATITINIAFGDGGLIQRAQQAKNLTEEATLKEQETLNEVMSEYANIMAEDPDIPDEPDPEPDTNTTEEPEPEPEPEKPTAEDTLKAGDYVTYPSAQGDIECRVLYDSTSEYGVQLITRACVGSDVTLGDNYFTTSMNSYNNAISTLNNAAGAYNNSDYSTARCVGSNPIKPSAEAGYFTSRESYMSAYNGRLKDTDTNYETDYNQMELLEINDIDDIYWLASRVVGPGSAVSGFSVRYVGASGGVDRNYLCSVASDGRTYANNPSYGLRPVFTLKSGIKVTGGNGESGTPYTLGL